MLKVSNIIKDFLWN